ncbi:MULTISPECIES: trimeric intracellular cation channel family protein [Thermoactinomyces]|jgi:uncharacterized membrane protein YeiH|uniref:Trimeric intracellular cation channel family protein n=1 Tax=Thermoactinomyces daqus TaxID=1329516 RepID=A0A7W2AJ94_9BACL|nr:MULTISPECIES: trimeric intracellular cation channel family protein [Thermoactinomyces]MBA4544080.1 trimeric intracellular cation channel family protein [Thermoactinomyces daqus]MBH8598206.1 trimeric intracellular cation channel family protein [Thermoactinomyces sp. CICC 10523]MBH8603235.1 trimeric intracellular cation channel family protein [Thermoactinomyces sp. CICC 10522]MBH8608609.1 trimeric intracellular cation channel family protein [Thermoactinomyces sp. CICC 10521]
MSWEWLNFVGIVAFAVSGALVAIEERYDIFGLYVLGLVTAFGGGIIRNACIGLPVGDLWKQEMLIYAALIAITFVSMSPSLWLKFCRKWLNFFDAIGLSAFSIQGALFATGKHLPLVAVIFAAVMTGIGGGIIRDVLAGRKPLVFQREVYAFWAIVSGVAVGLKWVDTPWEFYFLCAVIVTLRMMSTALKWHLPGRLVILKNKASR